PAVHVSNDAADTRRVIPHFGNPPRRIEPRANRAVGPEFDEALLDQRLGNDVDGAERRPSFGRHSLGPAMHGTARPHMYPAQLTKRLGKRLGGIIHLVARFRVYGYGRRSPAILLILERDPVTFR